MSSRGYLVDMIESIGEKTALASHIREKIVAGKDPKKNREILKKVLASRRKQMSRLMGEVEQANPDYWCDFKHAVKAWTQDAEVYEATLSEDDEKALVESSEILAMEISCLLGMDFETCARCVFDRLLVQQYDKLKLSNERTEDDNENYGGDSSATD